MNFTFVALKYNQPAAARRCQVLLDNIKTVDTKNIGKGLFCPQITVKPGYYGEEKLQPSAMLLHGIIRGGAARSNAP